MCTDGLLFDLNLNLKKFSIGWVSRSPLFQIKFDAYCSDSNFTKKSANFRITIWVYFFDPFTIRTHRQPILYLHVYQRSLVVALCNQSKALGKIIYRQFVLLGKSKLMLLSVLLAIKDSGPLTMIKILLLSSNWTFSNSRLLIISVWYKLK